MHFQIFLCSNFCSCCFWIFSLSGIITSMFMKNIHRWFLDFYYAVLSKHRCLFDLSFCHHSLQALIFLRFCSFCFVTSLSFLVTLTKWGFYPIWNKTPKQFILYSFLKSSVTLSLCSASLDFSVFFCVLHCHVFVTGCHHWKKVPKSPKIPFGSFFKNLVVFPKNPYFSSFPATPYRSFFSIKYYIFHRNLSIW